MTLNNSNHIDIIKYRISLLIDTATDSNFLLNENKLIIAVNRIYYAIFYKLSALALFYKYQTSKHLQLIGWFNKLIIEENIFNRKYYRYLKEIYKKRQKGNYEPFINFEKRKF